MVTLGFLMKPKIAIRARDEKSNKGLAFRNSSICCYYFHPNLKFDSVYNADLSLVKLFYTVILCKQYRPIRFNVNVLPQESDKPS